MGWFIGFSQNFAGRVNDKISHILDDKIANCFNIPDSLPRTKKY